MRLQSKYLNKFNWFSPLQSRRCSRMSYFSPFIWLRLINHRNAPETENRINLIFFGKSLFLSVFNISKSHPEFNIFLLVPQPRTQSRQSLINFIPEQRPVSYTLSSFPTNRSLACDLTDSLHRVEMNDHINAGWPCGKQKETWLLHQISPQSSLPTR